MTLNVGENVIFVFTTLYLKFTTSFHYKYWQQTAEMAVRGTHHQQGQQVPPSACQPPQTPVRCRRPFRPATPSFINMWTMDHIPIVILKGSGWLYLRTAGYLCMWLHVLGHSVLRRGPWLICLGGQGDLDTNEVKDAWSVGLWSMD